MTPILVAISNALHALATVIFVGHYLLLAVLYVPALSKLEKEAGTALSEISKNSRFWLYGALLVFFITGVYLTLVDPNYRGLGNFSTPWAILMLVKHLVIVVMIAMGFWFNAIRRVGPLMRSNSGAAQAMAGFRWYCNAMAVSGVIVLILTALAQTQ